jgi:ankyrin repeat protein
LTLFLQDLNAGDAEQRTPLHYACGFNHLEIAKMLLLLLLLLVPAGCECRRC